MYNDLGQRVCYIGSGNTECTGYTGAPLNESRTYTAYVSYGVPPSSGVPTNDVRATSASVTVTNVGWAGHFTSADTTAADQAFSGATSATFGWDEPLSFVHVDIVASDGQVIKTCSEVGSLSCTAALALGSDESATLHAEARANTPGGGYVTVATSGSVELAGMDANSFAEFLAFAPEASLPSTLGAARAQQVLAIRAGAQSETFCVALGETYPSNAQFHSSTPDVTLKCTVSRTAALRYLIVALGAVVALDIMSYAIDTDQGSGTGTEPEPSPSPQPDPIVPGGPNDPPTTAVDTCQIPPGVPDVYRHYTTEAGRVGISASGLIMSSSGTNYVTVTAYASGLTARADLALGSTPTGYFEIPAERLPNLEGPRCVTALNGEPGGGVEYWTNQPISAEGLTWVPIGP